MSNKNCDCEPNFPEVIEEVSKAIKSEEDCNLAAMFFKGIGDTTRIKILCALKQREMCPGDIAVLLDMTKSTVSHQLAVMRNLRQVKCRKEGKNVFYSLDDNHVLEIIDTVFAHINDR